MRMIAHSFRYFIEMQRNIISGTIFILVIAGFFSPHSFTNAQTALSDTGRGYADKSEYEDFTDDSGRRFRTVTSIGVGADVTEAAQNAAQNALSQVVGTFIQSSTSLDKKVKIENGIKNETKNIRTDIKEYSQGYVHSFSVVKIDKAPGFLQVTAKSTIRIDDFKAYIMRLAEGGREISGGLFAQLSVSKTQQENLQGLFSEKILAALNGQVSKIQVGEPSPVESLDHTFINGDYRIRGFIESNKQKMLIYFPIRIDMDRDFLFNMIKSFDATAISQHRLSTDDHYSASMGNFKQQIYNNNGVGVIVHDEQNGSSGKIMNGYSFTSKAVNANLAWMNDCEGSLFRNEVRFPSLEIKLIDFQEKVVFLSVIEANRYSRQSEHIFLVPTNSRIDNESNENFPWSLVRCTGMSSHVPTIIRTSTSFMLFMALDPFIVKNVKSIKLRLIH